MFGKRLALFEVLGFKIYADLTWLFLAVLVTWSLAVGLFPQLYAGLTNSTYWSMGVVGAFGLFASLIAHELSHSVVARRYGVRIRGITLWIFGGVAEMTEEPPNAKAEFLIAVVGPLMSIALAIGFYVLAMIVHSAGLPVAVFGVVQYLAYINLILALFNLVPAFPMDGGRMFRAAIWRWKGNLRLATRIASTVGSGFGLLLIALGVLSVITGNFVGGMWWFLIGLFLHAAASASYRQLLARRALEGESVRRFMTASPVTVPTHLSIRDFVEDYAYKHYHDFFPVTEGDRLVGCLNLRKVKDVPREEWDRHTVGEIASACGPENTVGPDEDAVALLSRMNRARSSRVMVVENGRLIGIIALKDLLQFLSVKLDLEEVN